MTPEQVPCDLRAGCKININLQITGVREDGYHELDSLFYPLSEPHDILHVRKGSTSGLTLECSRAGIDPLRNTLTRAYAAYAKATGFSPSLHIVLEKDIPQGAGLGGGSADAGALIRFLDGQAPKPLPKAALIEVAASVGADVPFFLYNSPCRVQGIGERLTPCECPLSALTLLLVCPDVHISTPWAYAAWDRKQMQENMPHNLTTPEVGAKGWDSCRVRFANAFEAVVFPEYPLLRKLKETLLQSGAAAAVMSGSGASLAAFFRDADTASTVGRFLQKQGVRVFVQAL